MVIYLSHTYSCFIFMKHLVVSTQSNTEDNSCHIFKAVDPLLSLWPLSSHIKQPAKSASQCGNIGEILKQNLRQVLYRPWATPCVLPEVEIFKCEMSFNNSSGFHSSSQDVLLCRLVICCPNSIKAVQVAEDVNKEGELKDGLVSVAIFVSYISSLFFVFLTFSDLLTIEQNRWVGIPVRDWSTPGSQHQPIRAS